MAIEIAQAVFTIVGILFGWTLIGIGEMRWTNLYTPLGILIIGMICLLALGIRFGGPKSGGEQK